MATVFLGHDLKHDRDVAIKVLHPDLGAALGSERFLSEIKTTAKLQHPHILPLLDSGEADSLLYYVMPFVVGESLRERIERERQLPIPESVRITREVASALDYAHRHGVIHRDIKPENILLHDGQALVADFGIALAVTAAGGGRMTQTGLSLGTPQYMSPEQAVGERTIDARSDIYSLAAVTYEMITGDPPFAGSTVQAVVSKIMTEKPTQISRLRETVPDTVENAVMIALSKLPADRFATAAEYASALTTPTTGFARAGGVEKKGTGNRRADILHRLAIPLAVVSALLLGTTLWLAFRPAPARQVTRFVVALDSTEAIGGPRARVALSPDGSRLVYTTQQGSRLMMRQLNQLHGALLPVTDEALSPFVSVDGAGVGYLSSPSLLKVASLNGGPPIQVSDSVVVQSGAGFGPDGDIYAVGLRGQGIVRVAAAPSAPLKAVTRVDRAAGETNHLWPEALPNGKGVLFTIEYGGTGGGRRGKPSVVALVDLATGKHQVLVSGLRGRYSPSGHLLYSAEDGALMSVPFDQGSMKLTGSPIAIAAGLRIGLRGASDFQVSRNGTLVYVTGGVGIDRELVWVGRDGKIEMVDPDWKGTFATPVISPDGKTVAVSVSSGTNSDIWVKKLDRGPGLRLTFGGGTNLNPNWSPDGQNITYQSDMFGRAHEIVTKRANGSAQPVLQAQEKRNLAEAVWSRDGKWLVVRSSSLSAGNGDILALRLGVDSVLTPLIATNFYELSPTLSPDGRWMAYSSSETGRHEVYVVPFPNVASAKWPVSTQGGSEPLWSHSGREIFYRDYVGNLVSVAVNTSPTFSAGATTTLFPAREFANRATRREYDVTPDDRRFVFVRSVGGAGSDKLVIVSNWFEELKTKPKQ